MKKFLILFCFLFLGANTFSQEKVKFKPGVSILEKEKTSEFKKPSSILFVFKGDTHNVYNFLDLEKEITKRFEKAQEKNESQCQFVFNYKLEAENPLEHDVESMPKKRYSEAVFETVCYLYTSEIKSWHHHLNKRRKQHYQLHIYLKNKESERIILKLVLDVKTYHTILTQNKNISKLVYDAIMQ